MSAPWSGAPDGTFAPQGITVPVERSHAHQGSDLSAVESAQFGQVCKKGKRDLVPDAGKGGDKVDHWGAVMVYHLVLSVIGDFTPMVQGKGRAW